jgi:hypothetical protein
MRRQEGRITRTELAMDTLPDVAAPQPTRALAARLDMSPSAVKVAAHRGYRSLRRLLGLAVVAPPAVQAASRHDEDDTPCRQHS